MNDFLPVLRVFGALLSFFALGMSVPWIISWTHGDGLRHVWAVSGGIAFAVGAGLWSGLSRYKRELQPRHGIFLAVSYTHLTLPTKA